MEHLILGAALHAEPSIGGDELAEVAQERLRPIGMEVVRPVEEADREAEDVRGRLQG